MLALAIALTVLLLLESVPSAVADLTRYRSGLVRLDQLTRLGVLEGRSPVGCLAARRCASGWQRCGHRRHDLRAWLTGYGLECL
ncbi:MAG TPA: hypothetical protein VMB74_01690 [Streptosporangiaceae bacterium]|nr:hypothetical protein [Streptosporangiaceae bacterium]